MDANPDYYDIKAHLLELAGNEEVQALEKQARDFGNNPLLPQPVRDLILNLWQAYSDARWCNELLWEQLHHDDRE